jgi:hypothetical protein
VNVPVSFTNTSDVSKSGTVTYAWTFGNGNRSTIVSPVNQIYPTVGNYNIKLVVTPTACPTLYDSLIKVINVVAPTPGIRYPSLNVLKNVATFKTVYSNKTFDYMACKKPILMAIDGISKELVEQADAGVFVQPENPEDLGYEVKCMEMNSEDMLIHDGHTWHYTGPNNVPGYTRKGLSVRFILDEAVFDPRPGQAR